MDADHPSDGVLIPRRSTIGAPSSGKSPALDAVLEPLRALEAELRQAAELERAAWREQAEAAEIAEGVWKKEVTAAVKAGEEAPPKPDTAKAGPEPVSPRLVVTDATVERLEVMLADRPRGMLMARDELTGWLQSMTRYANGGTDGPFWLEAYGGRVRNIERMGRAAVTVPHLSIGVVGGIQLDPLRELLTGARDDGLLARFLPVWPEPVPIARPRQAPDEGLIRRALERLHALNMVTDERDTLRPGIVPFEEAARDRLDTLRRHVRAWEAKSEGLLVSFIGKLPGLAVRLAIVFAYLDWAEHRGMEPDAITADHFDRAAHLVEAYALPMARRAYADASLPRAERAAHRLVALIRAEGWRQFSSRDVLRLERTGLTRAEELNPALSLLEEAEAIRQLRAPARHQGGRPSRTYEVNPAILAGG